MTGRLPYSVYALLLALCSVLSILFSGRVDDGFGSPSIYVFLAALIILALSSLHLIVDNLIALMTGEPLPWLKPLGRAGVFAVLLYIGAFVAGIFLRDYLLEETRRRGDRLAEAVERYRRESGQCPDAAAASFAGFRPAFRGSNFVIERGRPFSGPVSEHSGGRRDAACSVQFTGALWLVCRRDTSPGSEWLCQD